MTNNLTRILSLCAIALLSISCNQLTAQKNKELVNRPGTESFTFSYEISSQSIPSDAKSIEVIMPAPPSDDKQTIWNFRISTNLNDSQFTDSKHGNNILVFSSDETIPDSFGVTLSFNAIRNQRAPIDSFDLANFDATNSKTIPDSILKYTRPDALVPIDGPILREADSLLADELSPLQKAQKLYDHLFETMKYDKSGDGWGNGDALYACDVRTGNCTDIHSLFIGMARSQGIPARFRIGFPLPTEISKDTSTISGYHCWAEFYLAGAGWIPVDISEAIKHPEKKDYYFGRLDSHRIGFSIGRDISAQTLTGDKTFNYLIYPQVFIDGKEFGSVEKLFTVSKILDLDT